jgi:hypothetical protein
VSAQDVPYFMQLGQVCAYFSAFHFLILHGLDSSTSRPRFVLVHVRKNSFSSHSPLPRFVSGGLGILSLVSQICVLFSPAK